MEKCDKVSAARKIRANVDHIEEIDAEMMWLSPKEQDLGMAIQSQLAWENSVLRRQL